MRQDETVKSICLGNAVNKIGYFVTIQRGDLYTGYVDSVYCPAHDTSYIEITY